MNQEMMTADQKKVDLESWLKDYGTSLLRMCFLYLKDLQLAEDIVQETMVNAYLKYEEFNHQASVKSWLTRIAINRCKDYRRSAWFRRVSCVELEGLGEQGGFLTKDEVSDQVETSHQYLDLIKAVFHLPVKYREVILLYYYQELSIKETASMLAVPESTVSTRLRRAKLALKKTLGGWYYDEE